MGEPDAGGRSAIVAALKAEIATLEEKEFMAASKAGQLAAMMRDVANELQHGDLKSPMARSELTERIRAVVRGNPALTANLERIKILDRVATAAAMRQRGIQLYREAVRKAGSPQSPDVKHAFSWAVETERTLDRRLAELDSHDTRHPRA